VPKVTWGGGVTADDIDSAERSQFKPYDGPPVPNGMYAWRVKQLKKGKSQADNPKVIYGLELLPRRSRPDEKKYAGFYVSGSIAVVESQAFKLGPFLDALGVSSTDFLNRTSVEAEKDNYGNAKITKIGEWLNDGKTIVLASLGDENDQKGNSRKAIMNFWPVEETAAKSSDEDDDSEEEEEEKPTPRKKAATKSKKKPEPDEDEGEEEEEEPPAKSKKAPAKKAAKKAAPKRSRDEDEDADEDSDEDDEAPF